MGWLYAVLYVLSSMVITWGALKYPRTAQGRFLSLVLFFLYTAGAWTRALGRAGY